MFYSFVLRCKGFGAKEQKYMKIYCLREYKENFFLKALNFQKGKGANLLSSPAYYQFESTNIIENNHDLSR